MCRSRLPRTAALVAILIATLGACAHAPLPPADVAVGRAEFGLFGEGKDGLDFEPFAGALAVKPGQHYGWVMEVQTAAKVAVREELFLPASGEEPLGDDPEALSQLGTARRVAIREGVAVPRDGRIYREWVVGTGEPKGRHLLRVGIGGRWVRVFRFDVE